MGGKKVFTSLQSKGEKQSLKNNEDNNAVMIMIWMPVRGVWVCVCVW